MKFTLKKTSLTKICHTYPAMMELGSYTLPKEDSKNISHVTHPLKHADISIFSSTNQQIWLYQEIQMQIAF